MWIFARNGFASVVKHRDKPDTVLVRCRCKEDAEFFADCLNVEWFTDEQADYRYRMEAPQAAVADVLAKLALDIDYDNFKDSLPAEERVAESRHRAYMDTWAAMARFQGRTGGWKW